MYLDETGFAPSSYRPWARAAIGQRVKATRASAMRPRTSLIAAYYNRQLLAPMLFEGTCNTQVFNEWLEHLLLPELAVGSILVLDNATFHQSSRTQALVQAAGCTLMFLSPYSPDLNPIEKCWANLKRYWQHHSHLSLEQVIKECNY